MKPNKNTFFTALLLLLLVATREAVAQNTWQHINGLPCEEASAIMQGRDGYMWIGTRLGLIRYDGYTVKTYRNDVAHPYVFSSCDIKCLAFDKEERLYAGSFFGLNSLELRTGQIGITHFNSNDFVQSLLCDCSGRLWVGTGNGLYIKTDNGEFRDFQDIPHNTIYHLSETPKGDIIVVTSKHGIFRIDRAGRCTAVAGTETVNPLASCTGPGDTLWIGTRQMGLYSLWNGKIQYHAGYDECIVNDMLYDVQGHELILATDGGIYSTAGTPPSLKGANVQKLCTDESGNIWAATETQGVYRKQNYKTAFLTETPTFIRQTCPIISQFNVHSLSDTALWNSIPRINALYESTNGSTYVGTAGYGFYEIRDGKIVCHTTPKNSFWLRSNNIYAFCTLGTDSTLIGTWYGLYLMRNAGSGRFVGRIGRSDISTMHTLTIYHPDNDDIWLGLVGGIAHIRGAQLDDASMTVYTHVNKKGTTNVKDVGALTDKHDETGEYQLGGIFRIVEDKEGRIWACTSEPGLLLYDAEEDVFRSVSEKLGIPGDNVHSMDIDRYGNLWMTTNYGILQMEVGENGNPLEMQLYTTHEDLPTNYFGSTKSTLLADGSVCFINRQHLIQVVPQKGFGFSSGTKVFVSDILVNDTSIREDCFDAAPPYTSHIVLPHDRNEITIRLSSLLFGREQAMRYSYMLEGVDKDFRQTAMGENTVQYNLLAPGHYRFRYRTAESSDEQVLEIDILQPLWWRWWARVLYVIVILTVVAAFVRNIMDRQRKQRQLEILEIEKSQQEKFYQQRLQFYTRVFHEFMTPLTLMSDLSHSLYEKVRPSLQATLFMLTSQVDRLKDAMSNVADIKEDVSANEALQKAREMTQVDRDFLHRCTESVNRHIADTEYTHHIMMTEVGASHATLYRKLKALTGMDATSFIRSIRMRSACQILNQNPDIRISELAERVGYNNPRYFSTCFKNEFGMTPREYLSQGIIE